MEIQPVISEKSYALANAENKYTFLVPKSMSKIAIGKAVSSKYKVEVRSINTIVRPGKAKRDWKYGNTIRKSDQKKAVVQVKSGDKIDEFFNV